MVLVRRLLFFLAFLPLVAAAYTSPGIPHGFVNDFAVMLSASERSALEAKLAAFEKATSNEIAVVTVQNLGGDTIENFAVKLFEEWKIGKAHKDNGVLLLISRDDRRAKIEVGYGLEGALTDAQSGWILDNKLIPQFQGGNYVAGVNGAVDEIMAATRGEYVPSKTSSPSSLSAWSFLAIPFFIFLSLFLNFLGRMHRPWLGGLAGAIIGLVAGLITLSLVTALGGLILFTPFGFLLGLWASRAYSYREVHGFFPWWWMGGIRMRSRGFGGPGSGEGFGGGGFGGGSSGGGGASRSW